MRRATSKANLAEEPDPSPPPVITFSDPLKLRVQKIPEEVGFRELPDGTLLETIADFKRQDRASRFFRMAKSR